MRIIIEGDEDRVSIIIDCDGEAEANAACETLARQLAKGFIHIDVAGGPPVLERG